MAMEGVRSLSSDGLLLPFPASLEKPLTGQDAASFGPPRERERLRPNRGGSSLDLVGDFLASDHGENPHEGIVRRRQGASPFRLFIYCGGPSLERARPLLPALEKLHISVQVRTDEHLNQDLDTKSEIQDEPCEALLVLWSQYFQGAHEGRLIAIADNARKQGACVLNNVRRLVDMQDRRWLLKQLKEHDVPTPDFVECSRDGGHDPVLEEHDDFIVVGGQRINKPFVEKPVDRRDREIYVYFPKEGGGGRALLSTRESGDVEYVCRFDKVGRVRKEGSFVYQEYLQSEGFVVQAVCVGGLAYGNAVLSGVVLPSGARSANGLGAGGGQSCCAVWLRQEEKLIASKLHVVLQQTLFGVTFVRSQTANGSATSYVIDVWPGIPRSGLGTHTDDVVKALSQEMCRRAPSHGLGRSRSFDRYDLMQRRKRCQGEMRPLAEVEGDQRASSDMAAEDATPTARSSDGSIVEDVPTEDLLCVLLVARHAERTPKQKIKAKVTLSSDFSTGWICGWLAGSAATPQLAASSPSTIELRTPEQLKRFLQLARHFQSDGHEVGTLADALTLVVREGVSCHLKVGADAGKLVVSVKWGGELTSSGVDESEAFGRRFRDERYSTEEFHELHATLRHDMKIYASKEPRTQQTAAAFCKGLLRLDSPLPPIMAALVRTDEIGRLEFCQGSGKRYVEKAEEEGGSNGGTRPMAESTWSELEALIGLPCMHSSLRQWDCPKAALQELCDLLERFVEALLQAELHKGLYGGETPGLFRERYRDALGDLRPKGVPRFDKVSNMFDHLEYDNKHNREALPEVARQLLTDALPLCEALCDVEVALEGALERRSGLSGDLGGPGMPLLNKLRWDLRVASGADLGEERAHLEKHEALYSVLPAETATNEVRNRKPACIRTRLYFTHNSRLQGLLSLILEACSVSASLAGTEDAVAAADASLDAALAAEAGPLSSPPPERSVASSEVIGGFVPMTETAIPELLSQRLNFLAHFVVQLKKRRSDNQLIVSCHFSPNGTDDRVTLFNGVPLAEVDSCWSRVIDAASPRLKGDGLFAGSSSSLQAPGEAEMAAETVEVSPFERDNSQTTVGSPT